MFLCSLVVASSLIFAGLLEGSVLERLLSSAVGGSFTSPEGLLQAGWASKPEGADWSCRPLPGNLSLIVPALLAGS